MFDMHIQQIISIFDESILGPAEKILTDHFEDVISYPDESLGGRCYVTDPESGFDPSGSPASDIILLPPSTPETLPRFLTAIEGSNRGARIFASNEDVRLLDHKFRRGTKLFTYSLLDPKANFSAKEVDWLKPGPGYTFKIVFQARPQKTKMEAIMMPIMYRGVKYRAEIHAGNTDAILSAIKVFQLGMALSLDPNTVTKSLSEYRF